MAYASADAQLPRERGLFTDHAINLAITAAAAVFFVIVTRMCQSAGADTWAAVVIGLAASAGMLGGTKLATRRRT